MARALVRLHGLGVPNGGRSFVPELELPRTDLDDITVDQEVFADGLAVDAATGVEQWKVRGFGHGSLTYADGHFYVLGDRGRLALVVATPEGYQQRGNFQVFENKAWTVPTVADGKLFVRNGQELLALAVRK